MAVASARPILGWRPHRLRELAIEGPGELPRLLGPESARPTRHDASLAQLVMEVAQGGPTFSSV
jgi:hypothetical protein